MRTYYKLHLYFSHRSQDHMYWYSDKPLRNKKEIVEECVKTGYLVDVFAEFVNAVQIVSREEYLETMYED